MPSAGGGEPASRVSLRTLLFGIVGVTALYAVGMMAMVTWRIGPTARALQRKGSAVLEQYAALQDRTERLQQTIEETRALLLAPEGMVLADAPGLARAQVAALRRRLDSIGVAHSTGTTPDIPTQMRIGLAALSVEQSRLGAELYDLLATIELGRRTEATSRLQEVEALSLRCSREVGDVEHVGFLDLVASEEALSGATRAAIRTAWWWGAVGLLLLPVAFVLLRQRFYEPLADLDKGLTRIASGDLESPIPVRYGDELGRLSAHFNETTAVMRQRTVAEARRAGNLAERLGRILDESRHEIYVCDAETLRLVQINRGAVENSGYAASDLLQRTILDLMPEFDVAGFARLVEPLAEGRRVALTTKFRRQDGSSYPVEVSLQLSTVEDPPVYLVIVQDITERRALEAQLSHSQRLDAVGRLAGGVAHDFNNLLTAMLGYTQVVQSSFAADDLRRADLEEVRKAGLRAADLVRQLLVFARKQVIEPRIVALNDLVANLERMLRRLIGEEVELITRLENGIDAVKVDPSQFEQVLINLAVNARDAMPEGGTLTIATCNQVIDEEASRQRPLMRPGRYVQLAVSDTGVGMSPEVLERVFEPFFTTKEVGKGTGLGLATCYGIVKQAGGFIWAYSDLGHGTTFRVYLPAFGGGAADAPLEAGRVDAELPRGNETILVVEDQDQVRDMVARVLTSLGYRVMVARDGDEALTLANEHGNGLDLLLTDVVLPRTNGRRVAAAIGSLYPRTPVLFVSGHAEEAIVRRGELEPGLDYLPKPFTAEALARRVRAALDQRPA